MAETSGTTVDALLALIRSQLLELNICLPGVIVSYTAGRASVRPTLQKRYADGTVLDYPVIPSVRVLWPSFAGGQAGAKGPIVQGDKCLLVFAQHALDGSEDPRHLDLNDCFAIPCDLGAAQSQSADNSSMTVYYGAAFMKIGADGSVNINAPGGFNVSASQATVTASTTTMTTDLTVAGKETVTGTITGTGGLAVSGGAGAVVSGNISHVGGALTSNGVNIGSTHVHSNPEGGFTGAPQ